MAALATPQSNSQGQPPSASNLRRLIRPVVGLVVPCSAVIAALAVGAIMLLALGANPVTGYAALLHGGFGSIDNLADTAIKSTPLMLVGVGISLAFRAGLLRRSAIVEWCSTMVANYRVKTPDIDTPTRNLSGGNIQKVVIALDEVLQLSDRIIVVLEGEVMGEVDRRDATPASIGIRMSGVRADASVPA